MEDLIGRTLGNYRLVERLGAGAMGQVFRARQISLGRDVAVKVLLAPDLTDYHRRRFVREATIQTRLNHANLVKVFDAGSDGDLSYLVLELVSGPTLREVMTRRTPMLEDECRSLLAPLAGALAHLHAEGIAHRDVKPENVLLTENGVPKIGDFGLARDDGAPALTAQGHVIGTMRYMAPEHFSGVQPGAPADVYALGVILFEMLTGKVPYKEEITPALIGQKLHRPFPRASDHGGIASERIEALLHEMTRKDPAERPSMQQVLEKLEPEKARSAPRRRTASNRPVRGRSRWVVRSVTLAVLGLIGAGLWRLPLVRRGGPSFTGLEVSLSPDGTRVVSGPAVPGAALHAHLRGGARDWHALDRGRSGWWAPAIPGADPIGEASSLRLQADDGAPFEALLPRLRVPLTFLDLSPVIVDPGSLSLSDWTARFVDGDTRIPHEVRGRLDGERVVFDWVPPRDPGSIRLEAVTGTGLVPCGGGETTSCRIELRPAIELSRREALRVAVRTELEQKGRALKEGGKIQQMDGFYLRLLGRSEAVSPRAVLAGLEAEWKRHLADPAVGVDRRQQAYEWLGELIPLDLWCREWQIPPPFDLWGILDSFVRRRVVPVESPGEVGESIKGYFDFSAEDVNRTVVRTFLQYTYIEDQFMVPDTPDRPGVLRASLDRDFFDTTHEVPVKPPESTPSGSWGLAILAWSLHRHYYVTVEIPRVRGSPVELTLASPGDAPNAQNPDESRKRTDASGISWRNIPSLSRWIELEIPGGLMVGGAVPKVRLTYHRIPQSPVREQRGFMTLGARWFDPATRPHR